MKSVDPFAKTDSLDDATLDALASRFEARGKHPVFAMMLQEHIDAMEIGPAALVLDAGCGTGLAARAIARRSDFAGRVIGVDLSPHLVNAATRLAVIEGLAERLDFRVGNAGRLAFSDGHFDAVVAHTLLSHVDGLPPSFAKLRA